MLGNISEQNFVAGVKTNRVTSNSREACSCGGIEKSNSDPNFISQALPTPFTSSFKVYLNKIDKKNDEIKLNKTCIKYQIPILYAIRMPMK